MPDYARALFERYSNPAIRHLTWQIAMDGSQKLPQRILGTIAENLAAERASPGLVLAVAAWMRYVGAVDETGQAIDVQDPLAELLKSLSDSGEDAAAKVDALLSLREVFPESLATNPLFQNALLPGVFTLESSTARRPVLRNYINDRKLALVWSAGYDHIA